MQGMERPAWAQAVAQVECVCTTPAHLFKGAVKGQMRRRIRRGAIVAVDHFPRLQRLYDDHVRLEFLIGHAAGLNGHDALLPVHLGDVSPGVDNQIAAKQFHVGLVDALPQLAIHGNLLLVSSKRRAAA